MKTAALCLLLIGQSNMMGTPVAPPEPLSSLPPAVRYVELDMAADRPARIIHRFRDKQTWGPEAAIVHAVREKTAAPMLVVKVAKGSTSIRRWSPPGDMYRRAMALVTLAEPPKGCKWNYVLVQGEVDARAVSTARQWATKAKALFKALRRTLGPGRAIVARVWSGHPMHARGINTVRRQQALLSRILPGVRLVDTRRLARHHDQIHLTEPALRRLGGTSRGM